MFWYKTSVPYNSFAGYGLDCFNFCFSHSLSLQRASSDNLNAGEQGSGEIWLEHRDVVLTVPFFQPRLCKYQLLQVKPICQSLWDPHSHSSLPNYFHKTMVLSFHPGTSHFFPVLARQSFSLWSRNAPETLQQWGVPESQLLPTTNPGPCTLCHSLTCLHCPFPQLFSKRHLPQDSFGVWSGIFFFWPSLEKVNSFQNLQCIRQTLPFLHLLHFLCLVRTAQFCLYGHGVGEKRPITHKNYSGKKIEPKTKQQTLL